jgi:hypothetical protein
MIPRLLHPVPITIQQLDVSNTIYDEEAREPIQQASHAVNITIPGQVNWGLAEELAVTNAGPQENASGYVLFRYVDLNAQSVTLKQNDRFIKIGNEDTDVYVVSLKPTGHYPSAGGATLVKAIFLDRMPSRQDLGT